MKVRKTFPRVVRDVENVFIPVSNGGRVAARIWIPEDADTSPVPAILEYIPYRKGDRMRDRDETMHGYFAGHGYAAVRVDLRGTGDSDGVLLDEYLRQEIEDARDVIRWLGAQSWCTGAVGMMGKSWGGFNALQVAARGVDNLRAVIAVCCSDDRYRDDAHFMGGALLNENLFWGLVITSLRVMPPDPMNVGERWREMWLERLAASSPLAEKWLRHQRRDAYWDQGSVSQDYRAITCPVYLVGGWADAYTNGIFRLLAGLEGPRKGLIGPWAHAYPQDGVPGPPIGFLQEALRWWDQWLAGRETGILNEPMLRAWMPESKTPAAARHESSGRWIAESNWPPAEHRSRRLELGPGALVEAGSPTGATVSIQSPQSTGSQAGSWCPFGAEGMPRDQREDDGRSAVFDSTPLTERVEIFGEPVLRLRLSCDRPVATLAARLADVFPDGVSARVSYGILNLTHRSGHAAPEHLPIDTIVDVTLPLKHVAHAFLPGHRIRVALSTSYWPIVWPAPSEATVTLFTKGSCFELPIRTPRPEDLDLRPFEPPESAPSPVTTEVTSGNTSGRVHHDPLSGESVREFSAEFAENDEPALSRIDATGMEFGDALAARFFIRDRDPLSARIEARHHARFQRAGWSVGTRVAARMWCDERSFTIETDIEGFDGDERVFERRFRSEIPRDLA
ncbi:MAG TPA: CocE/NonD family hydrolase [Vicinamibacteria bacterium]|nr:CocE/NonD family hydrolase [Vicinamibacteria bacterium]